MPRELTSQAEYARRRGCARASVYKAIKTGRIRLVNGKIDPKQADRDWANNTKARADSAPAEALNGAAAASEFNQDRARRELAEAEKAMLLVGKMAGRYVDRAQAMAATFEAFRSLRDRVQNAPRRVGAMVVGMTDPAKIEAAITAELRSALGGTDEQVLAALYTRILG